MFSKVKYVLPVSAAFLIFCIMSLVITPLMIASPSHVPLAVVSLDKGTSPGSDANIGSLLADGLTAGNLSKLGNATGASGNSEDASSISTADKLSWTRLQTEEEAERAIAPKRSHPACTSSTSRPSATW